MKKTAISTIIISIKNNKKYSNILYFYNKKEK